MNYYIYNPGGSDYGPFTIEQLRAKIASRQYSPKARVRPEGVTDWYVLSELLNDVPAQNELMLLGSRLLPCRFYINAASLTGNLRTPQSPRCSSNLPAISKPQDRHLLFSIFHSPSSYQSRSINSSPQPGHHVLPPSRSCTFPV